MQRNPSSVAGMIALLGVLAAAPAAVNDNSAIGVNFWFFTDNQSIWPFVDFFKQSRPFWSSSSSAWGDDRSLSLDANGYPTTLLSGQSAATLLFWDAQGPVPTGAYTLLWDGDGDIAVDNTSASVTSGGANRIVVTISVGSDPRMRIRITRTNAANPLRNIRFIAPGYESTYQSQIFHPAFLEKLAPFRVLRFMDWMDANNNPQVTWPERNTPQSQTYANDHGVSIEHMVDLCNRLDADGWFCLPVRGTDACFTQYATYIRDHLEPQLKAHFEYGNEVWNGGVQRWTSHVESLGVSMGFSSGWSAQHHGWAKRMTDLLTIIENVYSGKMNQCVRVAATQVGNTGVADGILSFYNGADHADVLAVAPYFGSGGVSGTNDQIIAAIAEEAQNVDTWIQGDLKIAQEKGLRLVCYESGLDIWGFSDAQKKAIRFDPRMKQIYATYLDAWKKGGGTLMVQYTFCDPYWGLVREMDDTRAEAPMYDAALDWIAANPCWWQETRGGPATGATVLRPSSSRIFSRGALTLLHTGSLRRQSMTSATYPHLLVDPMGRLLPSTVAPGLDRPAGVRIVPASPIVR